MEQMTRSLVIGSRWVRYQHPMLWSCVSRLCVSQRLGMGTLYPIRMNLGMAWLHDGHITKSYTVHQIENTRRERSSTPACDFPALKSRWLCFCFSLYLILTAVVLWSQNAGTFSQTTGQCGSQVVQNKLIGSQLNMDTETLDRYWQFPRSVVWQL